MIRSALLALAATLAPAAVAAQAPDFASQELGPGYWHMFIAYAVAWVVVLAWTISIGRRLSRVERKLEE